MLLKALETFGDYVEAHIYPIADETGADLLKLHPNLFAKAPELDPAPAQPATAEEKPKTKRAALDESKV